MGKGGRIHFLACIVLCAVTDAARMQGGLGMHTVREGTPSLASPKKPANDRPLIGIMTQVRGYLACCGRASRQNRQKHMYFHMGALWSYGAANTRWTNFCYWCSRAIILLSSKCGKFAE